MDRDRNGRKRKIYLARHNPYHRWSEGRFMKRYRVTKRRAKRLAREYGRWTDTRTAGTNIGGGLSYIEQICLALRFFATGTTCVTIGETQQVSDATVSRCVRDVTDFLYENAAKYIAWPNDQAARRKKARRFHKRHHKRPFVFGCIDGTHIAIRSPPKNDYEGAHPPEAVYVNRKGFHSINAMVVCDADQFITHVNASFAGSANDQYAFASSQLYEQGEAGMWGDFFLLGDSGYTLTDYLLVPYDDPATPQQRAYNKWHRSTRSLVERTIGVLKQRWRCLDASGGYLYLIPERACRVITACCCLHNMCVEDRAPHMDAEDDGVDRFRPTQEPGAVRGPRDHNQDPPQAAAADKRDRYAETHFKLRQRPEVPTDSSASDGSTSSSSEGETSSSSEED